MPRPCLVLDDERGPFLFVRFIGMASHPRVKARSYLEYSVASGFIILNRRYRTEAQALVKAL